MVARGWGEWPRAPIRQPGPQGLERCLVGNQREPATVRAGMEGKSRSEVLAPASAGLCDQRPLHAHRHHIRERPIAFLCQLIELCGAFMSEPGSVSQQMPRGDRLLGLQLSNLGRAWALFVRIRQLVNRRLALGQYGCWAEWLRSPGHKPDAARHRGDPDEKVERQGLGEEPGTDDHPEDGHGE